MKLIITYRGFTLKGPLSPEEAWQTMQRLGHCFSKLDVRRWRP